jgi:hypothetical protein
MTRLSKGLRPRREKIFGDAPGAPLDGNAKARIMAYARAYNAKHRAAGQHWGPLTRTCMQVLEALLWSFHNSKSGRCFPSYETIAERARCNRDSVYEAIKALEAADVLTWLNRITRIRVKEPDLLGQLVARWQIIRTSNAYVFRDPLPCSTVPEKYKSENPPGTLNQELTLLSKKVEPPPLAPDNPLTLALARLGNAMAARIEKEGALSAA